MSEHPMIEKVARAIYEVTHGKLRSEFSGVLGNPPTFNELVFEADMLLRQEARAAIAAVLTGLSEPSKGMIDAGATELDNQQDSSTDSDGCSYSWVFSGAQTAVFQTTLAQARAEILGPKE